MTHILRFNRKFSVPAISKDEELDGLWASKINDCIQRSANCPSRVEHIVYQHDPKALNWEIQSSFPNNRAWKSFKRIISVKRDINHPERNSYSGTGFNSRLQALTQWNSSRVNSH